MADLPEANIVSPLQSTIFTEVFLWYVWYFVIGGVSGFCHLCKAKGEKKWHPKQIVGYSLFGALTSVGIIGYWYGHTIIENPFKYQGMAIGIGLAQVAFPFLLDLIVKARQNGIQ